MQGTEGGGLTFKGAIGVFRKLPFMPSLRVVKIVGLGSPTWAPAQHTEVLRALAAGLSSLPSLQVRLLNVFSVCCCHKMDRRA